MSLESRIRKLEAEVAMQSQSTMESPLFRSYLNLCRAGMNVSMASGPGGNETHQKDYAAAKADYEREAAVAGYGSETAYRRYPCGMSDCERELIGQVRSMYSSVLPPSIVNASFPDPE